MDSILENDVQKVRSPKTQNHKNIKHPHDSVGAGSPTIIAYKQQSRKPALTQRQIIAHILGLDTNIRLMWVIRGGGRVYIDCL